MTKLIIKLLILLKGIKVVCFDLDGTLISSYMENENKEYHDWHILANRGAVLQALLEHGIMVGVITNQGAVAFDLIDEREFIDMKMPLASKRLGLAQPVYNPSEYLARRLPVWVCYAHPKGIDGFNSPEAVARRKPSGAMLHEALAYYSISAGEMLYVGDRSEDEQAAQDAGVRFIHADDFFSA